MEQVNTTSSNPHCNQTGLQFMEMQEIHGIFVDSILTDETDHLVFASLWGSDTSIRELQARLTLDSGDHALSSFNLKADQRVHVRVSNVDTIEQMTGRVQTDIFGDLVHCFLFQRDIVKPDLANHRATLVSRSSRPEYLWDTIIHISPVPLLWHWQEHLLPIMQDLGMVTALTGIGQHGTRLVIDEAQLSLAVKELVRDGVLLVNA